QGGSNCSPVSAAASTSPANVNTVPVAGTPFICRDLADLTTVGRVDVCPRRITFRRVQSCKPAEAPLPAGSSSVPDDPEGRFGGGLRERGGRWLGRRRPHPPQPDRLPHAARIIPG